MPTGWFVVQPPSSGTLRNNRKPVSVQMAAAQLTDGSIAPIELKPLSVAMTGQTPLTGPMNIELNKLVFSMSGEEKTFGGLAVRLPKLSMQFEQDLFTGAMFTRLRPIKLEFALQTQGAIESRLASVDTLLSSTQEITGALASRLQYARAIIAGAHQQDGTIATAVKKVVPAVVGEVPKIELSWPQFDTLPTFELLAPLTTNIISSEVNVILSGTKITNQNTVGRTYQFAALFDVPCNTPMMYVEGTKGSGTTDRQSGIGIFSADGLNGIYVRARQSGQGTGQISTIINGVVTDRVSTTGLNWSPGNRLRLLPVVNAGIITWEVYKDTGTGFGTTPYNSWTDSGNVLGLPGNYAATHFHHIYSGGHYPSPGIAAFAYGDL